MVTIMALAIIVIFGFIGYLMTKEYEPTETVRLDAPEEPFVPEWEQRYKEWEQEVRRKAWVDYEIWGDYESHCPIR